MKVYNTLTNSKEEFVSLEPGKVKMYLCGPTVYNYFHVGNARAFVVFDTVRRYLEYRGYEVNFIQNFTDVDDKIINKAIEENTDAQAVSDRYIREFFTDADALNINRATNYPRVTEEMPEIIEMIETLVQKGYAYESNGTVFFDTGKFDGYCKLSNRSLENMEAGARIAVDKEKRSPMDFVLWKPAKPNEPKWGSPWSEGRPGWHIECSAMAKKYLGESIDIHAAGEDLIFPHHENEIAQSEAANGKPFSKYWLHNAMLNIDNKKMSKSKGNFFMVRDIVKKYSYDVIRFLLLNGHYRMPLNFGDDLLKAAENSLERVRNCVSELKYALEQAQTETLAENEEQLLRDAKKFKADFIESMDDDFNTANAITAIFEYVRFANIHTGQCASKEFISAMLLEIEELCGVLGLKTEAAPVNVNTNEIEELIAQRQQARTEKNWAVSDAIRDRLTAMGIILKDTPEGVKWSYKG